MLFLILVSILSPKFALAEDVLEVVVTANRLETSTDDVTTSNSVISAREIEKKQKKQVSDLLRDLPGLSVSSSGGPGAPTSVFVRGTGSDHVLMLIDGIKANDALSPARTFDFGTLSAQDIERIEVIRGSESVLYGSDAIGGVINIITKLGKDSPKGEVDGEYGTYQTYGLHGNYGAGREDFRYFLGLSREQTQGFPAADQALGNTLNTGESQTNVNAKFEKDYESNRKVDAVLRFSDSNFGLPTKGGPPGYDSFGVRTGDDPGGSGATRELYTKLQGTQVSSVGETLLEVQYSLNRRITDHTAVDVNNVQSHYEYDSHRIQGLLQNNKRIFEQNTLTLGLGSEIESGSSTEIAAAGAPDTGLKDKSNSAIGIFVQDEWITDSFFTVVGSRLDCFQGLGPEVTYRIAPGYKLPSWGTIFRASLGAGLKFPSLYQRYSIYGDPNLLPEKSISFDVGIKQDLGILNSKMELSYFQTDFDQLIDYGMATNRFANVGKGQSRGVEGSLRSRPARTTEVVMSYTYNQAIDSETGLPLFRRPRHLFALSADTQIVEGLEAGLSGRYVGVRDDQDAVTGNRVVMPGFAVFYVTSRYHLRKGIQIFGRIDNILNRSYEEVNGYGTPGRSIYMGLSKEI